ncbi:MAG: hypothetical protein HOP02_16165 [Methylococcaceae bacterium]|nr:hypothetical protein [Methylococcaceae bacterium]
MLKTDDMPMWVFLAFSSIATRKGAMLLIWSCLLFTLYCIPWVKFIPGNVWVGKLFLIDDWSWFAMMLPILLWYWLSLKWVDKRGDWENA